MGKVTYIVFRIIVVHKASLCQLFSHLLDVEVEFASRQPFALLCFARGSFFGGCSDQCGLKTWNHHDAVIVGHNHIARLD